MLLAGAAELVEAVVKLKLVPTVGGDALSVRTPDPLTVKYGFLGAVGPVDPGGANVLPMWRFAVARRYVFELPVQDGGLLPASASA